jgi:hypothetical protein
MGKKKPLTAERRAQRERAFENLRRLRELAERAQAKLDAERGSA